MGLGREAETEPMQNLGWGNTDRVGSKLKKSKGFLKPNFEHVPIRPGFLSLQEFHSSVPA
jgi:hypothetical protein